MFTPIKNFITYFQRNTTGIELLNSTNSTQNNSNDTEEMENNDIHLSMPTEKENNKTKLNEKSLQHDQNENEVNKGIMKTTTGTSSSSNSTITSTIVTKEIIDENKYFIDEKNSNSIDNCSSPTEESIDLIKFSTDYNPLNIDINKDLMKNYSPSPGPCSPSINKSNDIFANISPTKIFVNENNKYFESNHDNDIEFIEKFDNDEIIVDEEIIVLSSNDNNLSILDSVSDPLAIDDEYQNADEENNSSNLLQSGTSSPVIETPVNNGIICIIDVDNIKETGNQNHTKRNKNSTTNYDSSRNNVSAFDITNIKIEIGNEEQELRSDGSDSGLGLETSASSSSANSDFISHPLIINKLPQKSSLKRRSNEEPIFSEKKTKRSIHFNGVSVYYFPRTQGFACVPSQGGCTLGMGSRHIHYKTFSLTDYAAEQRRVHKQQMQEINPRSSSSDESDSDEEVSEASGSDLDADGSGFLQPVPARQRRALLKAAGIRKIDSGEKDECRAIRTSREFCGCNCRGYCDPDTCSCSQAGIKCQVDRPSFPCGCTRDGCANVVGRVEFNPGRVRTHFIHTIMRLEIENKHKRRDEIDSTLSSLPMLNYMNNCISDSSNMSMTASLNTCLSNNSSLSTICNYNVSNTSHVGTQPYHLHLQQQQQHNQNFVGGNTHYSNIMHNNSVSTPFTQENCVTSQVLHDGNQQQQHLISNNCMRMMNNGSSNGQINNTLDINLMNTNSNHSIDLSYPLRDMTTENSICNNLMIDFPTNSNQIFHHDVYSSQSYVNQSYQNQNLNSNINYHLAAPTYSNYQQSFISYIPQACGNGSGDEAIEIHDLASTSSNDNTNNYINLHPPTANSSRLDAINDLLHNNRNTPPTIPTVQPSIATNNIIIDPLPMKPTTVSALSESCSLASSGQTSTSVCEGTSTKITSSTSTLITSSSKLELSSVVDLTDDLGKNENVSTKITTATLDYNNEDVQIIKPLEILQEIVSNTEKINKLDDSIDFTTATATASDKNFIENFIEINQEEGEDEATVLNIENNKIKLKNKKNRKDNDDIEIMDISLVLNRIDDNFSNHPKDVENVDKDDKAMQNTRILQDKNSTKKPLKTADETDTNSISDNSRNCPLKVMVNLKEENCNTIRKEIESKSENNLVKNDNNSGKNVFEIVYEKAETEEKCKTDLLTDMFMSSTNKNVVGSQNNHQILSSDSITTSSDLDTKQINRQQTNTIKLLDIKVNNNGVSLNTNAMKNNYHNHLIINEENTTVKNSITLNLCKEKNKEQNKKITQEQNLNSELKIIEKSTTENQTLLSSSTISTITTTTSSSSSSSSSSNNVSIANSKSSVENGENLIDIIKKPIIETVSAFCDHFLFFIKNNIKYKHT